MRLIFYHFAMAVGLAIALPACLFEPDMPLKVEQPLQMKSGVPKAVPADYVSLYRQLSAWLDQFQETNQKQDFTGDVAPVFGAHLLAADANRGPVLLLVPYTLPGIEITIDRFRSLGVEGITLVIGYPMFLNEFKNAHRYLGFYEKVARMVRKREMKLLVELNVLFVNSVFTPFEHDFGVLTFEEFILKQRLMAQIIIDRLRPDYLTILHEPQTFGVLAELDEFYDPKKAAAYVKGILDGLNWQKTLVGAGAGNWDDLAYSMGIAETGVDYLSLHIYPVDPDSIQRAYAVASIAGKSEKALVLTEGWLYKSDGRDQAAQSNLEGWEIGFRRDVFGFWAPLDQRFIESLVCFARASGAIYVSPYWTNYMFAYVDYSPSSPERSYQELVTDMAPSRVATAVIAGTFTDTGHRYKALIRQNGMCAK